MKIAGFAKLRNEIVRENDLRRVLADLEKICDCGILCDDASNDGTREELKRWVLAHPNWRLLCVKPDEQDFANELAVKQRMLTMIHELKPDWVWWLDGDEVLEMKGHAEMRAWIENVASKRDEEAWRFHYTQFWRTTSFARTDDGFDDGRFVKLWKYATHLAYDVKYGTHNNQCPRFERIGVAPWEILHYGNAGKNLVWKCLQYHGGLGGVGRHLIFPNATYRSVDAILRPGHAEIISLQPHPPAPFTAKEIERISAMQGLRRTKGWFTVVVPAYNRGPFLDAALQSLLDQTYEKWVAVVLDDGSTDDTPRIMRAWQDRDPRIFYCRFEENRGGVTMNEIGMALAVEWTEFWSRLGSDDRFGRTKLELDVKAFENGHDAVYGAYRVLRMDEGREKLHESCNRSHKPLEVRRKLLEKSYCVSWANCAVRSSTLELVRELHGAFCHPDLRNMEDFLFNARVARETDWIWRGMVKGDLLINPEDEQLIGMEDEEAPTVWRDTSTGSSGNSLQCNRDFEATIKQIDVDTNHLNDLIREAKRKGIDEKMSARERRRMEVLSARPEYAPAFVAGPGVPPKLRAVAEPIHQVRRRLSAEELTKFQNENRGKGT